MQRFASVFAPLAATAALLPIPALAQSQVPDPYWPHMMAWGWSWPFFGPLFWILLLVVVIGFVMIGRRPSHHVPPTSTRPGPLDILKERFARGEIDKAEYEERRKVLGE